ncbi:MAG: type IV secretory system conjugative DNA transfer family protein, partial [Methanobacteriaceae archaeon]|nr:type IV secretory system conjugative DNA transfer family protein [Methanobacteriaceae archaeon]
LPQMPDNTVNAALKQCLSAAENTFRSILITATSFLAMFNQNPKLAAMLSHSTFTLEDLVNPKTALFLVTDDTTSTADPILGSIDGQTSEITIKIYNCSDNDIKTIKKNYDVINVKDVT